MQNTKKYILFYIDCFERVSFYKKIADSVDAQIFNIVFLTDSLSAYLRLKNQNVVYLIDKFVLEKEIDISSSLDVLNNNQSETYAKKYAGCIYGTLDTINKKGKLNYIFLWNGSGTNGCAIRKFADDNNIKTGFMELSNFPGKIFVDIKGVNAKSWLYANKDVLRSKFPNAAFDRDWLTSWYEAKMKPLPQKQIINRYNRQYKIDRFFSIICNRPFCNEFNLTNLVSKLIKNLFNNKGTVNFFIDYITKPLDYIFLPLQVSTDSQLKLNSDYNNVQCILEAEKIAKQKNKKLVVKFHPAEKNKKEIIEIVELSKKRGFFISDDPTMELLSAADLICVNNSTVGLEAKILGKEVIVFGRALYESFDRQMAAAYLNYWLIDIDYFNDNIVSFSEFNRIIELIEYSYVN